MRRQATGTPQPRPLYIVHQLPYETTLLARFLRDLQGIIAAPNFYGQDVTMITPSCGADGPRWLQGLDVNDYRDVSNDDTTRRGGEKAHLQVHLMGEVLEQPDCPAPRTMRG